jgi:hypothetical protein
MQSKHIRACPPSARLLHDQRGQRRGEAAAQGGALGAEAVVAEPGDLGARLQATEARGELAVAGAEAGGARAELLEVPLLARAGAPRGLPVRGLATAPPFLDVSS